MGLLEKALNYKKKINSRGLQTVMDKIRGPAETDSRDEVDRSDTVERYMNDDNGFVDEIFFLDKGDLSEVRESDISSDTRIITGTLRKPVKEAVADAMPESEVREKVDPGRSTDRGSKEKIRVEQDDRMQSPGYSDKGADYSAGMPGKPGNGGKILDYMVLYEIIKELLEASDRDELFEVILFSIMGQIGASSSSIMLPGDAGLEVWSIVESRGVNIERDGLVFNPSEGILSNVIARKEIIDLEDYKGQKLYEEDYYRYISIDSRILVPMMYNSSISGLIILGNKLTGEDYNEEEKDFLRAIAEFSSFAYRNILFRDKDIIELDALSKDVQYIHDIDVIKEKIVSQNTIEGVKDIIRQELTRLGILGFTIFTRNNSSGYFDSFICDSEDSLMMEHLFFSISPETNFIKEIGGADKKLVMEEFRKSKSVVGVLTENQTDRMSMLRLFPFSLSGELLGFIMIFNISDDAKITVIDGKLSRLTDYIFPYIKIMQNIQYQRGKYIDNIQYIYNRIENEIRNAANLNIPLTVILFSIKNYKRFLNLFGLEKTRGMIDSLQKFLMNRLSDGDFSVRYDRHKILVVLPGKDKKFAVPLANAVTGEITRAYSRKEVQLLLTHIMAEYPHDGGDIQTLISAID